MVEYSPALDHVFSALGDPTRRAILGQLRRGPAKVTDIAAPFPVSLNAISKHIMALERAGLVSRQIRGRDHYCSLRPAPLRAANAWLAHYQEFWEVRLDALEQHIAARRKLRRQ